MLFRKGKRKKAEEPKVNDVGYTAEGVLYSNGTGAMALGIDPTIGYRGGDPLKALAPEQFGRWWDDRKRQADTLRDEEVSVFDGIDASEHDPDDVLGAVRAVKDFNRREKKQAKKRKKEAAVWAGRMTGASSERSP